MGDFVCDECGKTFKSASGLSGHRQFVHAGEREEKGQTKALAKPGSLDAAVEKLQVPAVPEEFNGAAQIYWGGFNKGVNYGVNTIMAGIRSAQELSSLGIAQATPIIKMAQEMRQAEGRAAQELAAQLGQATMQSNHQIISAINNLAASQPGAPDLWQGMMARQIEPLFGQAISRVMGGFMPQMAQPGQAQSGVQPPTGQQSPQQPQEEWAPPNVEDRSIDEYEEEMDV